MLFGGVVLGGGYIKRYCVFGGGGGGLFVGMLIDLLGEEWVYKFFDNYGVCNIWYKVFCVYYNYNWKYFEG